MRLTGHVALLADKWDVYSLFLEGQKESQSVCVWIILRWIMER
jgi:hypothetical protein